MKKIIIAVLCMLLTAGALAGCGEKNKSEKNADLSIVATIFPDMTGCVRSWAMKRKMPI